MKYDPEIHHRRSIRLRGYDYSRPGCYFVTVCTQDKQSLFGRVVEGAMVLNEVGQMVRDWWGALPRVFATVEADSFVVMPNHIHGIVRIVGADPSVRPRGRAHAGSAPQDAHTHARQKGAHMGAPLHRIVQWYKTMTTNDYIRGVKNSGWARLDGKLWQRNYYEQIVRNSAELDKIREYITTNSLRWGADPENPDFGAGV